MLAWVAVPAVCGLFNPSEWHHDVGQSLYMAMVWGMPYAACRWAYRNQQDLVDALRVIVYLGLGSLVLAAFEFAFGRFWYTSLVGHHPYVDQGPSRYFGYRPLLFMEDPNQIGMWWTTVALAAMGLVRVRSTSTAGDKAIMPGWLAGILAVPPFLFQAIGAAILTIVGAVALACHRKTLLIAFVFLIGVGGVGFALRGPLLRHGRQFVESSPLGPTIRNVLRRSSIGSFGWRLGLEESTIELIRERALVGSGSVNFWREISRIERPWGMATLITGAYGLAGLSAWTIMFLMPCYMGLAARDTRGKHHDPGGRSVLRALLVILFLNFVDAFLNCGYLLPCLCLLGLVNSWIETTQE